MRILFLTQYYLPETGAPQNRISGLANEMKKKGVEVEVFTAMPNYPVMKIFKGYEGHFYLKEEISEIPVHRAWIFATTKRNILFRLLNYFSFVLISALLQYKIKGKFDYVICESPPLFLGMSARFISRRKKARLIFNVSDLWPESAVKLNIVTNKFFLRLAYKLEASLYRSSYLVTGQTKGICSDISNRFPDVKTHWLPNGIDPQRFDPSMHTQWREKNNFSADDFILLYAGILGHAQGLECIIKAAAALKDTKAKFVFFGDGPEKKKLTELVSDMKLKNVFFFQPVSRELIPEVIAASNAAVIPLRKLDIFTGAIPSKIFETLAMGKPVILGVEGEAKELFIDTADAGLFFRPEDSDDLTEKIKMLMRDPSLASSKGSNGRRYVLQEFNREAITDKLIKRIEA